jgi:hypothetical protein
MRIGILIKIAGFCLNRKVPNLAASQYDLTRDLILYKRLSTAQTADVAKCSKHSIKLIRSNLHYFGTTKLLETMAEGLNLGVYIKSTSKVSFTSISTSCQLRLTRQGAHHLKRTTCSSAPNSILLNY